MLEKFLDRVEFDSYEDFKENYKLNIPQHFNFGYDVVDAWAKEDPNKPALLWCNDESEEKHFSFGEVKEQSDKAACFLKSLGLQKGDTVMLMLKQRPEVWFYMVALCKMGVICIPATYQLTPKDIVYRSNAADIKMIISVDEPGMLEHISQARPKCNTLEFIGVVGTHVPKDMIDMRAGVAATPNTWERTEKNENKDPMLIYFSSGTTGMPKMILHDFTYPLGHITTAKYWQCVEDGGRHLTVADSGWAKFGWGKIYGQWICGAIMVGYDNEKFDPVKMLKMMEHLKLTSFCAPPTVYRFLIKEDLGKYNLSTIKHAGIAGEPLNPEVYNQFLRATGIGLREGFGQSETSVIVANFPWLEVKPGSMGKPSPLYEIDIVDEEGNSCEDGIVGALVIKNTDKAHPTGLFQEYYRDPEAMARSWKDGVYNTGDTAWRDADGYLWFVGRSDDVIKCSGYRIGPFEVESALLTHPSVLECAITAVPDPVRGQVVKATVVLAKGYSPSEKLMVELQDHVKLVTAPYKYPRVLEFVEELPKTLSGKIRRVQIRDEDSKRR